jgi:hypothetical protein
MEPCPQKFRIRIVANPVGCHVRTESLRAFSAAEMMTIANEPI